MRLPRYNQIMREISISSGEHDWPFSKGLIVESLLNANIEREPAIAIARRVEQRLLDEQKRVVSPSILKILVTEEARAVLGPDAADILEAQTSAFEDIVVIEADIDRKSTRLNSSHRNTSRMPSSA